MKKTQNVLSPRAINHAALSHYLPQPLDDFNLAQPDAVNDPAAGDDAIITQEDTSIDINVLANDSDPDGDTLTYKWWQYKEPGTYTGDLEITDADKQQVSFVVPENMGTGETVHIICEVTDSGNPPLTRYRRVIVKGR